MDNVWLLIWENPFPLKKISLKFFRLDTFLRMSLADSLFNSHVTICSLVISLYFSQLRIFVMSSSLRKFIIYFPNFHNFGSLQILYQSLETWLTFFRVLIESILKMYKSISSGILWKTFGPSIALFTVFFRVMLAWIWLGWLFNR